MNKHIEPFPYTIGDKEYRRNITTKLGFEGSKRGINVEKFYVVLFSSQREEYPDEIDRERKEFKYLGEHSYVKGRKKNDQELTEGNLALINSRKDDVPIHLFWQHDSPKNKHEYMGEVRVVEFTWKHRQIENKDGHVFTFILKCVDEII